MSRISFWFEELIVDPKNWQIYGLCSAVSAPNFGKKRFKISCIICWDLKNVWLKFQSTKFNISICNNYNIFFDFCWFPQHCWYFNRISLDIEFGALQKCVNLVELDNMLQNEYCYLPANIGFDIAENEPSRILGHNLASLSNLAEKETSGKLGSEIIFFVGKLHSLMR